MLRKGFQLIPCYEYRSRVHGVVQYDMYQHSLSRPVTEKDNGGRSMVNSWMTRETKNVRRINEELINRSEQLAVAIISHSRIGGGSVMLDRHMEHLFRELVINSDHGRC